MNGVKIKDAAKTFDINYSSAKKIVKDRRPNFKGLKNIEGGKQADIKKVDGQSKKVEVISTVSGYLQYPCVSLERK